MRTYLSSTRTFSLASAALYSAIASTALPVLSLVTGPLIARALGPDDRGLLAAALAPPMLVAGVLGLGLPTGTAVLIARGHSVRRVVAVSASISAVSGALGAAALFALTPRLTSTPEQAAIYMMASATLPVVLTYEILRRSAEGLQLYRTSTAARWFSALSRTIAIVALYAFGALTLSTAGPASWLPGVVAVVIFIPLVWRIARGAYPAAKDSSSGLVGFSIRAWGSVVAGALISRADQVILAQVSPAEELGFYVIAVSLAELSSFAVLAVSDVVLSSTAKSENLDRLALGARLAVLVTSIVAIPLAVVAPVLLPFLFGEAFRPAVPVAQLLLLAGIVQHAGFVVGAGLSALGVPGRVSVAQFAGLFVSIALLLGLAQFGGAVAASVASLVGYATTTFILVAILLKRHTALTLRSVVVPRRSDVAFIYATALRTIGARK
jgi:O-antigen/teichoic acid export membrane protein